MIGRRTATLALVVVIAVLGGCTIEGTPTWPGARLDRGLLTAADFPPGVQYDRIVEEPGRPDGGESGGPPAMLTTPEGCSDGLTRVISKTAERGPGSAAKYVVAYDGARILVTVLSWQLDLEGLSATAERCANFHAYFDRSSPGIPMTTTRLPTSRPGALAYEQTMELDGIPNSVYFSFENVDDSAVFGIAFPAPNPAITVKATLPQTFLDVLTKQAEALDAI